MIGCKDGPATSLSIRARMESIEYSVHTTHWRLVMRWCDCAMKWCCDGVICLTEMRIISRCGSVVALAWSLAILDLETRSAKRWFGGYRVQRSQYLGTPHMHNSIQSDALQSFNFYQDKQEQISFTPSSALLTFKLPIKFNFLFLYFYVGTCSHSGLSLFRHMVSSKCQ